MTMFITMNDEAITLITFAVPLRSRAPPRSFFFGGGGQIHGTQTHLSPKSIFSLDFGHFILKMFDYSKIVHVSRKKLLKYHDFWGTSPADFSTAGDVSPRPPPTFGTHAYGKHFKQSIA